MKNYKPKPTLQVSISEFSKKGNGLGEGKNAEGASFKVEVPFTLPGDIVMANLRTKRGGVYSSKLQEILTPAINRIKPRCVHFAACGGCRLQHLSYDEQLAKKEAMVRDYFKDLITPEVTFYPIVACESPWQYRNKMEFSFSQDTEGKKYLGLVLDGGKGRVLNLTECHLVNPWFMAALKAVNQWWHESDLQAYNMHKNTGSLRTLTVREGLSTQDRMIMLTVSGNPDFALHRHHLEGYVAFLRSAIEPMDPSIKLSIYLRIQQIAKGMPTNFYEMHLHGSDTIRETLHIKTEPNRQAEPITFNISPSAFFQPNTRQAEKLYSLALQHAAVPNDAVAYDLYCGTGTLGICMSKKAKQVIGVEISPESSLDARENAKYNKIDNFTVFTGPVSDILKTKSLPKADIILVDPPRPGLDAEALKQIAALNSPKIVYISCNPATQATNIADLVALGYKLETVQPVDQFPQTLHIENIAVLTK